MTYFKFDDSLKVENKLIDQEHMVLIDYINLLQKAVKNETSIKIVGLVLGGLTEYTRTHFFVEEEMMKAFEYPDVDKHKAAHEIFKDKLAELIHDYENDTAEISDSALSFLKYWLIEHILKTDRQLSDFLALQSLR